MVGVRSGQPVQKPQSKSGRRVRRTVGLFAAVAVVVGATSVTAVALLAGDPEPDAAVVQAAVDPLFTGPCKTADNAIGEVRDQLDTIGYASWTIESRAAANECVAPGIDVSTQTVILVPVDRPEVGAAMEGAAEELMTRCLGERAAIEFVSSVLSGVGVADFDIRTDGPFAYPTGKEEAVRKHVAAGCFVYSGSGRDPDGKPVYYISGNL